MVTAPVAEVQGCQIFTTKHLHHHTSEGNIQPGSLAFHIQGKAWSSLTPEHLCAASQELFEVLIKVSHNKERSCLYFQDYVVYLHQRDFSE